MAITVQSAKAKGRKHQQWVRDKILSIFPKLEPDDCRSTSMGCGGEDIQLSPVARKVFPYSIECKARKHFAVYKLIDQAIENCPQNAEPLVVLKADRKTPLVVVDAEHFFNLYKKEKN